MSNPFEVRWLKGWIFEVVLMDGCVQVEAKGFGICLRSPMDPGETPQSAADRLVMAEEKRRLSLQSTPPSLIVVQRQPLLA